MKWYLPPMMGFGAPFFGKLNEVLFLDAFDRPIIKTVYTLVNNMWIPLVPPS